MTIRRPVAAAQPASEPSATIPEKLVKPWKLPPPKTYIFKNANVVDPISGTTSKKDVKTSDGYIASVGDNVNASSSDIVVDLEGKYLCPGLIDCHVHITAVPGEPSLSGPGFGGDPLVSYFRQPFVCKQMLDRGFTSVRDTGGATLALKEAIEDNVFPGPRLFIANKALSQTGGHGDVRGAHDLSDSCCTSGMLSTVVDGVADCTRTAREQLRTGADFIKIMTSGGVASPTDRLSNTQFTAAEVQAITEVAESYNTYVTAHAYTPKAIRHSVDNGVGCIEHGNLIDEETAAYMADNGVYLTPTLVTYDAMASSKYSGFLPPANAAKNKVVLEQGLNALRMAHKAGVKICHGSDLLGPLQDEQSREFEIRARVLDGATILRGATVNAATILGQESVLGQIQKGFKADLLVVQGNPLEDVKILSRPEESVLSVVKDGRVWKSRWEGLKEDVSS